MSSTTAIQLTEVPTATIRTVGNHNRFTPQYASSSSVEEQEILQASREVDSTAPDGGYGWVIVASGSVILWWSVGTTYAWGVMQEALVERGLSGPATLSFVGSLAAALVSVLAVVNQWLAKKVGVRPLCMVGVAFMGVSEVLSSFAVGSVPALFVTVGVLFGIGSSLCFVAIATVPSQYFSTKRGLANGLIFAGSGFGGAAISFALDALNNKLGPAWAYRILGFTTLATGLPAAWFMKERIQSRRAHTFIEWRLFKSLTFVLVFAGTAVGTFPLYVPPFFLPLYAKALGLSSATGAGLVAGFSLTSAVGRILSGVACDRFGSVNVLLGSLILTALSMLAIWPASESLGPLIVFVLINGTSNGGFFSTMPTVVSNVFGSARSSTAISMVITGWVGGYLMGAPIAGYLLQAFGGAEGGLQAYRPAMWYAGSLALVSAGMILAARLRLNKSFLAKV